MIEKIVKELCDNLQNSLDQYDISQNKMPKNKVTYMYRSIKYQEQTEYSGELNVNNRCIFKEVHFKDNTEVDQTFLDTETVTKEHLAKRILAAVFNYGVMASKKVIDNRDEQNKQSVY